MYVWCSSSHLPRVPKLIHTFRLDVVFSHLHARHRAHSQWARSHRPSLSIPCMGKGLLARAPMAEDDRMIESLSAPFYFICSFLMFLPSRNGQDIDLIQSPFGIVSYFVITVGVHSIFYVKGRQLSCLWSLTASQGHPSSKCRPSENLRPMFRLMLNLLESVL